MAPTASLLGLLDDGKAGSQQDATRLQTVGCLNSLPFSRFHLCPYSIRLDFLIYDRLSFAMEPQKTEQLDHSGLQFVIPEQAPEVVPESDLIPVERRSSIHSPEAFTPPAQNKNRNDYYGPRQGHFTEQTDERPYYAPPEYEGGPEKHGEQEKKQKRVCGLRRAVFFWMLGLVILLIIIAAVLGGVLGSVLHGSSSP